MDDVHRTLGKPRGGEVVMGVTSPGRRLRSGLSLLGICLLAFSAPGHRLNAAAEEDTGTFEKLIVASGSASPRARSPATRRLRRQPDEAERCCASIWSATAFLTVLVFNGELRGPLPGSVAPHSAGPRGSSPEPGVSEPPRRADRLGCAVRSRRPRRGDRPRPLQRRRA